MQQYSKAVLGGGCFWCMVQPFDQIKGVIAVRSGYTDGDSLDPDYNEVCSGESGHVEVIEIVFDETVISYLSLLDIFWKQIDPTDKGGQFVDRGSQYESVIFYCNEQQRKEALSSRKKWDTSGRFSLPILTDIRPLKVFYPAEDYHQDYHHKNPQKYQFYRMASGRDNYLQQIWIYDNKKADPKKQGRLYQKKEE